MSEQKMISYLQDTQQDGIVAKTHHSETKCVLSTVGNIQESILILLLLIKLSHS